MVGFPFVPCVERVKGSSEAFLEAQPRDLIQAGKFQQEILIYLTLSSQDNKWMAQQVFRDQTC